MTRSWRGMKDAQLKFPKRFFFHGCLYLSYRVLVCVVENRFGVTFFPNFKLKNEIKGPDNPTCQLLPTSSKRKVKMAWEMQEREKRWSRIGVCNKEPVCEEVVR